MFKKGLTILFAACLIMSFAACGAGNVGGDTSSQEETSSEPAVSSMAMSDAEDNLDGLCKYLQGNGIFVKGAKTQEMQAKIIGAEKGIKYQYSYEKGNIAIELYEFDPANLNADAKAALESGKANGTITVLEKKVENVTVSDNGKYLMIYTDSNLGNEANTTLRDKALELFKGFKA